MKSKRLLLMAAIGVGLLSSGVQAFARDRDDFRGDRYEDRREDRQRYERRWDRDDYYRREIRERQREYRDRDDRYYNGAPAYGYAPQYYAQPPAFSGSFSFGSRH